MLLFLLKNSIYCQFSGRNGYWRLESWWDRMSSLTDEMSPPTKLKYYYEDFLFYFYKIFIEWELLSYNSISKISHLRIHGKLGDASCKISYIWSFTCWFIVKTSKTISTICSSIGTKHKLQLAIRVENLTLETIMELVGEVGWVSRNENERWWSGNTMLILDFVIGRTCP
jgi:hypothetical protein